ncbi:class I SAM-dependent methyltransferase [Phycicoccus duodecadis]|uniref:class I SAM-dependent methyltransferase n=1 Tax=Phycicoccus duodecadis TaxID=173053 RepID=UPI0013044F11|nr:class I SAM-dependent methyltransferase [Phycicoccus duodecadis]
MEPGRVVDGVRCEDLQSLSFDDKTLDVVLTQDVMEHVMDPARVLSEIHRVLAPGGVHLATFPWNPDIQCSRPRAVERDGHVVHLLEPQFHGNPVGDGRSLVTWDWGADLFGYAEHAGFALTVVKLPHSRRHGIDGEYRDVFVFSRR